MLGCFVQIPQAVFWPTFCSSTRFEVSLPHSQKISRETSFDSLLVLDDNPDSYGEDDAGERRHDVGVGDLDVVVLLVEQVLPEREQPQRDHPCNTTGMRDIWGPDRVGQRCVCVCGGGGRKQGRVN